MRTPAVLIRAALLFALALPVPALADDITTIAIEVIAEGPSGVPGGERFVSESSFDPDGLPSIAAYGPFRVLDSTRAALVDATDSASPRDFARLLKAFPQVRVLEMIECPGTSDDTANLRLGRMIHRAGIATEVPPGGSVRSGAVELFLAGAQRRAAPSAEFAVHSWRDADGLEARDFPASDPVNQAYLAYYREMGLSEAQAQAFYAMTNAVPHDEARWLDPRELAAYAPLD
jgi:hypothetical protein